MIRPATKRIPRKDPRLKIGHAHGLRLELAGPCEAGKQGDHDDRQDVLNDEDAEDQAGEALRVLPSPSSALMMIVVEEIERIAPRKMLSI